MNAIKLSLNRITCLQKVLDCTEIFLASAKRGDFTALPPFIKRRNTLFKAFRFYDDQLKKIIKTLPQDSKISFLVDSLKRDLKIQERLTYSIQGVDSELTKLIEGEKERLQHELVLSEKHQKIFSRFKSHWLPEQGEQLDGNG